MLLTNPIDVHKYFPHIKYRINADGNGNESVYYYITKTFRYNKLYIDNFRQQMYQINLNSGDIFNGNNHTIIIPSSFSNKVEGGINGNCLWLGLFNINSGSTDPQTSSAIIKNIKICNNNNIEISTYNNGILVGFKQSYFNLLNCQIDVKLSNTLSSVVPNYYNSHGTNHLGGSLCGSDCSNFIISKCCVKSDVSNIIINTSGYGYDLGSSMCGSDCSNFTIQNCLMTGNVSNFYSGSHSTGQNWNGFDGAGGICGSDCVTFIIVNTAMIGKVINSYISDGSNSSADYSSDAGGAITGSDCNGFSVLNCYSNNSVVNNINGSNNNSSFDNTLGYDASSGIIGSDCSNFNITDCYSSSDILCSANVILYSTSSGHISEFDLAGGLVGSDSSNGSVNTSVYTGKIVINFVNVNVNDVNANVYGQGLIGSQSDTIALNYCFYPKDLPIIGDSTVTYSNNNTYNNIHSKKLYKTFLLGQSKNWKLSKKNKNKDVILLVNNAYVNVKYNNWSLMKYLNRIFHF